MVPCERNPAVDTTGIVGVGSPRPFAPVIPETDVVGGGTIATEESSCAGIHGICAFDAFGPIERPTTDTLSVLVLSLLYVPAHHCKLSFCPLI